MNTTLVVFNKGKIVMTVYNIETKERLESLKALARRDYGANINCRLIQDGKIIDDEVPEDSISDNFV